MLIVKICALVIAFVVVVFALHEEGVSLNEEYDGLSFVVGAVFGAVVLIWQGYGTWRSLLRRQ